MCDRDERSRMHSALTCACEGCGRSLGEPEFMLSMTTDAGERRAYECPCGDVTVTVVRT